MQIEPTITIGTIVSILVTIGSVWVAAWKVVSKLSQHEMKINMMWKSYKKQHGLNGNEDDD